MLARWDADSKQLVLDDGSLANRTDTPFSSDISFDAVSDVTLINWYDIIPKAPDRTDFEFVVWRGDDLVLISSPSDDVLQFSVSVRAAWWESDAIEAIMRSLCKIKNDVLADFGYEEDFWTFIIQCSPDARTTADIFAIQDACERLLYPGRGHPGEALDVNAAYDVLRIGAVDMLVGLAESEWLEVKSQAYDIDSFAGEVELAQDVARFANGDCAALLVLGFRTKRQDGVDRITKAALLDLPPKLPAHYLQIVNRRVYPPIEGLLVERVEIGERCILMIRIPKQPEGVKPFLVHGAVVGGKNEGSFISIVRRRGEESTPIAPAEIHALLSAGRASLRQHAGEVSADSDEGTAE